jgi:3-phenylpropionate/cinnamic acid dioxygenase small subunit
VSSTDEVVARLAAEAEIRNLVARLAHLADDGDLVNEYMPLYTDDATWGMAGADKVASGHAEILAAAQERRTSGVQGPGSGLRHLNTTLWISIDGPVDARAQSYFVALRTSGPDGTVVATTARYDDTFRRTSEGWKLASRCIVMDVT